MAESFGDVGDPDYTIRIRADWSEFDDDVRNKIERSNTFAFEGGSRGPSAGRPALPDYSRAGPAAEQFSRAIERQVQSFERMTAITRHAPAIENIYIPNRFSPAGALPGPSSALGAQFVGNVHIPNNYGTGGNFFGGGGGVGNWGGGAGGGGWWGGGFGPWWGGGAGGGGGGIGGGGGGGGPGYGWWPGNAGWVGPPKRRTNPRLDWRMFYAARLISETVGGVANAASAYNIQQMNTLGDPSKIAEADIGLRHGIANAIPWGIGKIGLFLNDPFGKQEGEITRNLNEAGMQDANTAVRQQFSNRSLQLSQSASMAGLLGTPLALAQIEAQRANVRASLNQSNQARYDVVYKEHMATMNRLTGGRYGIGWDHWDYTQSAQQEDTAYQQRLKVLHQQFKADRTNLDEEFDKKTSIVQAEESLAKRAIATESTGAGLRAGANWDLSEQGLLGRRGQLNTQFAERMIERAQLIASQRQREDETALHNPTLLAATIAGNATALRAFDINVARAMTLGLTEIARTEAVRDITTRGVVESNALRAQYRPVEAANAEMRANRMSAWMGANPDDRDSVWARESSKIDAYNAQIYRERGIQNQGYQNAITTGSLQLARKPLAATMADILGQQQIANMQMPQDAPQGLRNSMNQVFDTQRKLAEQQYNDQRALQTADLKRQEKVTGMLATAVGPGAPLRRMEAQVANTSMEAEERAQALLRQDITNLSNADRERRIGINRLRMMKAEYLEGFSAQEGSLYRTNLSPSGASSSPEQVLNSIDQGIKDLANKIGTLVATD